jgi:hypothetical protein
MKLYFNFVFWSNFAGKKMFIAAFFKNYLKYLLRSESVV